MERKRASALQLNESLKKSNNFTPRGPPRRTVARDPELYSPMYVRKGPGGNIQPPGPKTQSDIHGPISPRSNKYIPPPPPKIDTTIHGGNTVYIESLNQMAKHPLRTSFVVIWDESKIFVTCSINSTSRARLGN